MEQEQINKVPNNILLKPTKTYLKKWGFEKLGNVNLTINLISETKNAYFGYVTYHNPNLFLFNKKQVYGFNKKWFKVMNWSNFDYEKEKLKKLLIEEKERALKYIEKKFKARSKKQGGLRKMNEKVKMGVYNKSDDKLQDFGVYETIEEALDDLINYDMPKGRYGIIEDDDEGFSETIRTLTEAKKLLREVKKK